MRSWLRVMALVCALTLVVTGCSDDGDATDTTVGPDLVTTLSPAPTPVASGGQTSQTVTTAVPDDTSATPTTTRESVGLPDYQIAYRGEGDDEATVVVLLDPESYTTLSDVDIQQIIRDVYDLFPPVSFAHVVDTQAAVELVVADRQLDEGELTLLSQHYLARLEEGIRIVYVGPFDQFPIAILGS